MKKKQASSQKKNPPAPSSGKKRVKLHEVSLQHDIRYRGPLSFLGFQILGWLCIVASFLAIMMKIGCRVDPSVEADLGGIISVLGYVTSLSLPFLLIANFAKILNNSEGYRKQLIRNGGAMAAIFGVSILFFTRYIAGTLGQLTTDPEDVMPVLMAIFNEAVPSRFFAFNLFVDLFLCSLFMFFLNARPKRFFTGKKVLILRFLTVLPVAYEVASMLLKAMAATKQITLPYWSFPLLTVKPPMTFVVFMVLAIHVKVREYKFCKHGRSHEEYQAFLQTNRNSLHFSIYLAVLLIIAAIVDLIILMILMANQAGSLEAVQENLTTVQWVGDAIGFGHSIPLMLVAPIVLLFSYTRVPKNKSMSMLVPMGGIALIVLLFFEGVYQAMGYLEFERVNVQEMLTMLSMMLMTM